MSEFFALAFDKVTIGAVLIAVGLAFDFFGCVGLVRLPDVYTRLQAATKCVTLGTCLILLGALVASGEGAMIAKGILCMVFVLVTSPTAAHALARGAYLDGIRPTPSVIDKYADVAGAGAAPGEPDEAA
jgi:multicomponent Na+:H+ antiporter subunit G